MRRVGWLFVVLGLISLIPVKVLAEGVGNLREDVVGTFSLFKMTEEGKEVLYRINTKTGQVWCYSEYLVLNSDSLGVTGKEKEGVDKLLAEASRQGKHVYTMPFWAPVSEKRASTYTIH